MARIGKERLAQLHRTLLSMRDDGGCVSRTQTEIAAAAGINRSIISIALALLAKRGLLRHMGPGRYRVFDSPREPDGKEVDPMLAELRAIRMLLERKMPLGPDEGPAEPPREISSQWRAKIHAAPMQEMSAHRHAEIQRGGVHEISSASGPIFTMPVPNGEMRVWHERDALYPAHWQNFHADAYGHDSAGLIFALHMRHDNVPLPVLRRFVPDPDDPRLLRELSDDEADLLWCPEINAADLLRELQKALRHGLPRSGLTYIQSGDEK